MSIFFTLGEFPPHTQPNILYANNSSIETPFS